MDDGARTPDPEPTVVGRGLSPGAVLGHRYRIERQLGRGGMGEVWQAYDLKLRVEVALKSLHAEIFADDRHREMLRREVRTARDVLSPNVCRMFDLVEIEGQELVSMEYIDGSTLLDLLRNRGPLELREAGEIASQFLAGLEAIHQANLVHRDLKPENIMITRSGRVVVMDFGIAKGAPQPQTTEERGCSEATELLGDDKNGRRRDPDGGGHTIAGTPAYMAPEQMRGEAVDARADVFSAGVILAEMVSASGVKDRETRKSIWAALRQQPAQVPDTPWQSVIRRCVSTHPDERYDSARSLSRALEEITLRVDTTDDRSPYPGLAAFTEDNAEFFFGREAEVEEVWRKLQASQMLAVIGPSGVGKSSFLRAGLIPAAPEDWNCVIATPGYSPFSALAQALAPLLAGDTEAVQELVRFEESDAAISAARRWRRKQTEALLILDQFEELFTQNPPEVQARFAKLLGRLALEADVRVLLSLRDDFFFRCHEFSALAPLFSEPRPLGPPTGASLRRALVQPALICGYRFEDETLVDEMVAELGEARGALPLLAFAAARLWDKRDRDAGQLTRAAYEAIGGVGGALAQHAEATLEKIGTEHQDTVREIFRNLVTSEGTRRSANVDQLLSVFSDQPAARDVLQTLIDARLLTTYETDADGEEEEHAGHHRVEIVHEVLLSSWPRLVRWQTQDADGAQLRDQLRQAAQLWEKRSRSDDLLWTGTAFREFQLWRDRYPGGLTTTENDYAEAMVVRDARQRRRRRLATTGAFAVLVAVLIVVGLSRQQAIQQARLAEAKELVALGQQYIADNHTMSLACAIASLELVDSPRGRRFAMEALWKGPPWSFVNGSRPSSWFLDFSPDGKWLAEGHGEGRIAIWSQDGGEPTVLRGPNGIVHNVAFHPERPWLLSSANGTDTVSVWSVPGGELVRNLGLEAETGGYWGANGRTLLTATGEADDPLLWRSWSLDGWQPTVLGRAGRATGYTENRVDAQGTRFLSWTGNALRLFDLDQLKSSVSGTLLGQLDQQIVHVVFDPDGRQIAAGEKGKTYLWSSASGAFARSKAVLHHEGARPLRFNPAGSILATASTNDGSVRLWDLTGPPADQGLLLRKPTGNQINDVAFHPSGRWVAVAGAGNLRLWPLTREYPRVLRGQGGLVRSLLFDPEGKWLVSAHVYGSVRLWSLAPDSTVNAWTQPAGSLHVLAMDPQGSKLLVGGVATLRLLSRETGEMTRRLDRPELEEVMPAVISTVTLGPEGRLAAATGSWGNSGVIGVFDLESDGFWTLDEGHGKQIGRLAFTPDGKLLSSSSEGLRLWDVENRTHELIREEPMMNVSRDGQRILIGTDSDLFVFDRRTGETIDLPGHRGQTQGALDSTGQWVVTGSHRTGEIRYGPVGGDEPHLLLRHRDGVYTLEIDPHGRWIASGGMDGTVRLWPIPTGRPFHTLPYEEFMERLRAQTNVRMVKSDEVESGYDWTVEPFPGWAVAPTW